MTKFRAALSLVILLLATQVGFAQTIVRAPTIVVDSPALTLTTGTADTAATPTTGAQTAIVQFKFATVVGSYGTCTVQAKTSVDGSSYLTLSTAASVTISSGTSNSWVVTAAPPTSGNTSTPSTTATRSFGQLTKYTVACSSYGTSAPVTVSVIYSPEVLSAGGAIPDGANTVEGSTIDARCTTFDTTACTLNALLKAVSYFTNAIASAVVPVSTHCTVLTTASTNGATCKAASGYLAGWWFVNTTATLGYIKVYNLAANPTCSSATGFLFSIPVPASATGAGIVVIVPNTMAFSTGLALCGTGGGSSTDNTNAPAGIYGGLFLN